MKPVQTHFPLVARGVSSPHAGRDLLGRLFKSLFIVVICLMNLSSVAGTAVVNSQDDKEFAEIIVSIANLRKTNRLTAIDVTSLFKPMTDHLSLTEWKDYFSGRYVHRHGTERGKKYELVDIHERELKSFDAAFLYKDSLSMSFDYSDDGKTVTKFQAVLLNDQL